MYWFNSFMFILCKCCPTEYKLFLQILACSNIESFRVNTYILALFFIFYRFQFIVRYDSVYKYIILTLRRHICLISPHHIIYVYVYVYVCVCVCVCVCMYMYMYVFVYVYVCICVCMCMCMYVYVYVYVYVHVCICICVCMYMYMYVYVYVCICM